MEEGIQCMPAGRRTNARYGDIGRENNCDRGLFDWDCTGIVQNSG
jgi:hypothetical protein